MARDPWVLSAKRLHRLMRLDTVELYVSEPDVDSMGEWADNPVLLGTYKANVTTPPEMIAEDIPGTLRTHNYEITLAPEVRIPTDAKIFVKLVEVRQGTQGAMLEVTDLQGGLLGQTLTAVDEQN